MCCNAWRASPFHVYSTFFVEYLKDVLENCLFVLKTEANLYMPSNVLETENSFELCLPVVQRGCNWN